MKINQNETRQFSVWLPKELIRRIKVESVRQERPVQDYMNEALQRVVPNAKIVVESGEE